MRRERINRCSVRVCGRDETRPKEDAPVCLDLSSKIQIMVPLASKKRKRDDAEEDEDGRISFKLSALPQNQLGPVLGQFFLDIGGGGWKLRTLSLVGFPGVRPPANTPFQCYRLKTTEGDPATVDEKEFAEQSTFVAAGTDDVEFFSNSEAASNAGCTYVHPNQYPLYAPGN